MKCKGNLHTEVYFKPAQRSRLLGPAFVVVVALLLPCCLVAGSFIELKGCLGINVLKMGSLDHKWIELDQNRSKRIIIDQNGSKWIKMDQNGSKWIKMDHNYQNRSEWIKMNQNRSKWITMDHNWSNGH